MRGMFILMAVAALISGCSEAPPPPVSVPKPPVAVVPKHNYAMKEGLQYGYQRRVSAVEKQAGQVTSPLVMAYYAGSRGGVHQAHLMDGVTVSALECENPCRFIKVMTYIDNPLLRHQVKVERIAAEPDSIAFLIMEDALAGRLRAYAIEINGKKHSAWVDEKRGMRHTLHKPSDPAQSVPNNAQK